MKKITTLFAGSGVYALAQWLMISLLAHTGGPKPVGQLSLAISLVTPLAVLSSLSSRMLLQIDTSREPDAFRSYWQMRIATTFLFVVAIFVVIVVRHADSMTQSKLFLLVGLFKLIEGASDVLTGLAQKHDAHYLLARSLLLRGLGLIVPFGVVVFAGGGLELALFVISPAWLLVALIDWQATARWHGRLMPIDPPAVIALTRTALPVGISVFLSGFNLVIPRLVLEHYEGVTALGLFSAFSYALTLGNLIVGSMSNTLLTRLGQNWASGDLRAYSVTLAKGTASLVVLCAIGTAVAWLGGDRILLLLYGHAFTGQGGLFLMVVIASCVVLIGTFWSYCLVSTRSFGFQLASNIIILVAMIAISLATIPGNGAWGAAWSLLGLGVLRSGFSVLNLAWSLSRF